MDFCIVNSLAKNDPEYLYELFKSLYIKLLKIVVSLHGEIERGHLDY